MLEVNTVSFSYSSQGEQDAPPALREVNLRIEAGETVAIIGQNGSGKSTLAKLLSAIIKPTKGTVLVDGLRTGAGSQALWTIHQRVGIVFQNPDDQLVANTVIDDIAFGPENLGLPRFEIEERVQEAIQLLELQAYTQMAISELSVGQKQRVAIAGVLAMRPLYLILDEPTTMISTFIAHELLERVHSLARERGIAVMHITHVMQEVTAFERVVVMDQGRIVMDGTPAAIFARANELRTIGLDVPVVTKLGEHLRANGWTNLPEVVLSTAELDGYKHRPVVTPSLSPPLAGKARNDSPQGTQEHSDTRTRSLFELENVRYTYLHGTPFAVEGLRGLSLSIPAGQATAIVGPTQSGKSTLVDMLAGLIKPAAGTMFFEGIDTSASSFDVEDMRSHVGVVFQSPEAQIFEDTVGKDVSYGPRRKKLSLAESRRLVQEALEAVGLSYEDFRTRYTYALSGGQKRRVAIAGVLALQPQVIVFDEPAAGLDPRGRDELLELISRFKERDGLAIIYMSRSLEDVIDLADFVYILNQGRTILSGTPREIVAHARELAALDIALPEAAQIALTLHDVLPGLQTDVLNLEELEREIHKAETAGALDEGIA